MGTLIVSSSDAPAMHRASFRAFRNLAYNAGVTSTNVSGRGLITHRRVQVKWLRVGFSEELKMEDGKFWEVIPEGRKERVGERPKRGCFRGYLQSLISVCKSVVWNQ